MVSRFELFTGVISAIYRSIQKIERDEMEKYGLRGAYAQYLLAMSHYPEGITAAGLCEVCDKDKAAVSRAAAEMTEKGLMIRQASSDNLYRAKLKLTDAGYEAARFVAERASAAVEAAGNGLTDDDRSVFYAALGRIAANLKIISQDGIPQN